MSNKKRLFIFTSMFILGCAQNSFCQSLSNYRSKKILVSQDTTVIDSLSIIPNSFTISGFDTSSYKLLFSEGKLVLKEAVGTTINVTYKVFPFNVSKQLQRKIKNKNKDGPSYNPYNITKKNSVVSDIFGENTLNKSGSISRGINFGNTRDLSISSNLNLQLIGRVQDIEIAAAITDNNIPIQPEGNTQQLQDFDQVSVQFSKNGHKLIAGDYTLKESTDQFLRFNKKAQGLNYTGKFLSTKTKAENNINFGAAISRGKFGRNVIVGVEGNQGPYQLSGSENEQFIIILSGSEKIFIDGRRLKRGLENDYVIDYNSGDITFTSNQLITKDKRITVEFQYSDRNYSRTLFNLNNTFKISNKTSVNVKFYSEQDMKFQQLLQTLSSEDIALLSSVGDSLQDAVVQKTDSVEFNTNQVLYEKMDSVVDALTYEVYKYSTNPTKAIFQLSFSLVGKNKGYYVQEISAVNGRVYSWIAPVNNVPQGQYEPELQIISPKQKQMMTATVQHQFSNNIKYFIETAISNNNKNLFSSKHKEDDQGLAIKSALQFEKKLKSTGWELTGQQDYQLISKNFNAIERFRSTEFERNWNSSATSIQHNEHSFSLSMKLLKDKLLKSSIQSSYIDRGSSYQGLKNNAEINYNLWKGSSVHGKGSLLNTKGEFTHSNFIRHEVSITQNLKIINAKLFQKTENKLTRLNDTDSLLNATTSDNFKLFGIHLTNTTNKSTEFGLMYTHRLDYIPVNKQVKLATTADDYEFLFQKRNKKKNALLKFKSVFRQLHINDSSITYSKSENTLLNRLEFDFSLLKGMISSKSFFEIGTGNELKREFTYVQVTAGQGIYAWNDYNLDGVQQLNEFVTTNFTDLKEYIRVFLPSTNFIRTFNNQLTQTISVNPRRYLKQNSNTSKFISRFSNQTFLRLNQKNAKDNTAIVSVPFKGSIDDSTLISINSSFRSTIYFNRSNPIFGLNYSITDNQNKSLLLHGFDTRRLYSQIVSIRYNVIRSITVLVKVEQNQKSTFSQIFSSDDYEITSNNINPKIQFQSHSKFRIALKSEYKDKKNSPAYGTESSIYSSVGMETNYSMPKTGRLNFEFNFIKTSFHGNSDTEASSPLQFEMLEGLQVGNNYTWTARYQQTFKNNLQANVSYEGRSSPGFKVVHTGTFQIQLLF